MKSRMMRLVSVVVGMLTLGAVPALPAWAGDYPPSPTPTTDPPQLVELGRDPGASGTGLAFTGSDMALIAIAVAVLVAVGITLVVLGRRRAARAS